MSEKKEGARLEFRSVRENASGLAMSFFHAQCVKNLKAKLVGSFSSPKWRKIGLGIFLAEIRINSIDTRRRFSTVSIVTK